MSNICRLCLCTYEKMLTPIFDSRLNAFGKTKQYIIAVTTGVTISINERLPKLICDRCDKATNKIFEFRQTSIKNNAYIKAEYEGSQNSSAKSVGLSKSVRRIMLANPTLKFPRSIMQLNISPLVLMNKKDIGKYLNEKNIPSKNDKQKLLDISNSLIDNNQNQIKRMPFKRKSADARLNSKDDQNDGKLSKIDFMEGFDLKLSPAIENQQSLRDKNELHCRKCNKVYRKKGCLLMHEKHHKLCHWCKKHFASIDAVSHHLERHCLVKTMLENQPVVNLLSIDRILETPRHLDKRDRPKPNPTPQELLTNDFTNELNNLKFPSKLENKNVGKFFTLKLPVPSDKRDKKTETSLHDGLEIVSKTPALFEFRNLQPQLRLHNVPINIHSNKLYSAKLQLITDLTIPEKETSLWSDLKKIDLIKKP